MTQQHEATRLQLASWAKEFAPVSEEEMEPYLHASTDRGTDNWLALGIIARRVSRDWERRIQDGLTAVEQRTGSDSQRRGRRQTYSMSAILKMLSKGISRLFR